MVADPHRDQAMITASDAPNAGEVSPNRDACSNTGGVRSPVNVSARIAIS